MIERALTEAKKSDFERTQVGAVISKGNRILSVGHNQIRGYRKCPTDRVWKDSLHAEQDAILKLLNKGKLSSLIGSTLYVSRRKKNGDPAIAKPCPKCQSLILAVGIKKVVYTTDNQETESYKP
jgi:deoxycytidylate deaminase